MDDYTRVATTGVTVPRPQRGLIRLTGPQAAWFLQNTVTNDVDEIPDGRWVESCFLDAKGKVLAHFRVGRLGDELWLDVDDPGTETLVDWFTRYRFRTKVEIEDVSPGCHTVLGPPATQLAADGLVVRTADGVIFGGALGDVAVADVHSASAPDAPPAAPPGLYEVLRLEAGVPAFGVDYGPNTLPQEAGLTNIVSVEKGCYIGQEVMARLHFRGHINRVLRPLTFAQPDDPSGKKILLDGAAVGTVTSYTVSPARGPIGLGMVRVEPPEGTEVELEDGGRAVIGPIPAGTKVSA